jgi:hypothetical protein
VDKKSTYTTPKLTVHGDIRKLTQGNLSGAFTDKDFPAKTPTKDLTFSG